MPIEVNKEMYPLLYPNQVKSESTWSWEPIIVFDDLIAFADTVYFLKTGWCLAGRPTQK